MGQYPVDPAFKQGRAVPPPDRVNEHQMIGPCEQFLFRGDVLGCYTLLEADKVWGGKDRVEAALVQITNFYAMALGFKRFYDYCQYVMVEALSVWMGKNNKSPLLFADTFQWITP